MLCGALSRCVQVRKVSLTIDSCQRASNLTTDECQDGQENNYQYTTNTSTMPRSTFGLLFVMPNQHVRLKMQKELSSRKVKPSWILLKQEIKESNKPNVLRGMAKNQQRSS